MPELPEVETTVKGLRKEMIGLKILDVWTDLKTKDKRKKDSISNPRYFSFFKKEIKNKKNPIGRKTCKKYFNKNITKQNYFNPSQNDRLFVLRQRKMG